MNSLAGITTKCALSEEYLIGLVTTKNSTQINIGDNRVLTNNNNSTNIELKQQKIENDLKQPSNTLSVLHVLKESGAFDALPDFEEAQKEGRHELEGTGDEDE